MMVHFLFYSPSHHLSWLRLRAAKSLKLCGRCKLQKLQDKSLFSLRIGKGKLSGWEEGRACPGMLLLISSGPCPEQQLNPETAALQQQCLEHQWPHEHLKLGKNPSLWPEKPGRVGPAVWKIEGISMTCFPPFLCFYCFALELIQSQQMRSMKGRVMLLPSRQRAQKGSHESWRADRNRRERKLKKGSHGAA